VSKSNHVSINRVLLAIAFALATPTAIQADVPGKINFQGILKDGSGNPVADGSYSVLFTIYDAPTGGSSLWSQSYSVTTSNGLFTVLLGDGPTPITAGTFDDSSRYLGIQVGADPEMSPRQPLASVGYSFASAQWTSSSGDLYRLNGNVGIGSTPSAARLDVQSGSGTAISAMGGLVGLAANGGSYGINSSGGTYGIAGASSGYIGVYGQGGPYGVYGLGSTGVYGDGGTYGVYGLTGGSGDGVYGISSGGNGVNANGGTRGVYAAGGSYGVVASTGSGTGVYASSSSGPGVYATGGPNGVIAYSTSGSAVYASGGTGDGVYGYGSGNGLVAAGGARGIYATGISYGVVTAHTADFGTALYASAGITNNGFAGQFLGLVDVYGDFNCYGSKSAAVKMDNGEYRAVYAQESPENWFEDFGTVQLVKGRAVVTIEPGFAQTVTTTAGYHVFLTPKGDCRGLYVTNESATSFEIRELQKGRSDLAVSYRIVAKRKGFENVRLAKVNGPTPEQVRTRDQEMQKEMAANAASQVQLHAGVTAEFAKREAERVALEQQRALANPGLPSEDHQR